MMINLLYAMFAVCVRTHLNEREAKELPLYLIPIE